MMVDSPIDEKGDSRFNLNDAEALTEADMIEKENPLDFVKIDNLILKQPKLEVAQSAITAEDLAFEASLQRMHVESVIDTKDVVKLTKEVPDTDFLGDMVENYKPASTLNELDQQAFAAAKHGATAIEATEHVIRYYVKDDFEGVSNVGYFMFNNIRVFIPGKFSSFVQTDKQNINTIIRKV